MDEKTKDKIEKKEGEKIVQEAKEKIEEEVHIIVEETIHDELKFKKTLDKFIYVVGIIGPLIAIPTLFSIFANRDSVGISPISWIAYLFVATSWLTYGVIYKNKPIIISYSVWVAFEMIILNGIYIYR